MEFGIHGLIQLNFFKKISLLVCCLQKVIFLLNEFVFGEKLTAAGVAATKRQRAILLARAIFLAKVEHIRILIFGLRVYFLKKKLPRPYFENCYVC